MKISQKDLEKYIWIVIAVVSVIALVLLRDLGKLLLSVAFALVIVAWPFWQGSLVRYKLTPAIDSLNEPTGEDGRRVRNSEDFSTNMRAVIWGFVGLLSAAAWSFIVPAIFSLPLWIGRIAGAIGWKSLISADGVWQYGWMIVFLVQYVANLLFGFATSNDSEFYDRFEYR